MGSAVGILAEGESFDGSVHISKYLDLDSFLKGGSLQKKGKKMEMWEQYTWNHWKSLSNLHRFSEAANLLLSFRIGKKCYVGGVGRKMIYSSQSGLASLL